MLGAATADPDHAVGLTDRLVLMPAVRKVRLRRELEHHERLAGAGAAAVSKPKSHLARTHYM